MSGKTKKKITYSSIELFFKQAYEKYFYKTPVTIKTIKNHILVWVSLNKFVSPSQISGVLTIGLIAVFIAKACSAISVDFLLCFYILSCMSVCIGYCNLHYIGLQGFAKIVSAASMCFVVVLLSFFSVFVCQGETLYIETGLYQILGAYCGSLSIYIDKISYSFALLTSIIGLFAFGYASTYMRFEQNAARFLALLKAFELSMVLLVISGSWFTMILGWEMIGVTSFLLINFWSFKITTLKSAFKAFCFNKVSDCALLFLACITLSAGACYGPADFNKNLELPLYNVWLLGGVADYCVLAGTLAVIASFCKSAQIGFHFWLPDSMEAPVPASALIHSATLVSAGIYLMLRTCNVLSYSPVLFGFFSVVSSFTALYGAAVAAFQTDVKKVLAYSTISHCGFMMYSVCLFKPEITLFYLFAHGVFKSLSFLCVGNLIQYGQNYQDVSKMGMLIKYYPAEAFVLIISLFNLSSSPLFFSFFSKHWLINSATYYSWHGFVSYSLLMTAAFFGFFYSVRIFNEALVSNKKANPSVYGLKSASSLQYTKIKNANRLSLYCIFGLLLVGTLLVFLLWDAFKLELLYLADSYQTTTPSFAYALAVFFTYSVILMIFSYLSYAKLSIMTFERQAVLILFCAVFILI